MKKTRFQIKHEAKCFLIWRTGVSLEWECNAADIAALTKIPVEMVRRICRERDWPLLPDRQPPTALEKMLVIEQGVL